MKNTTFLKDVKYPTSRIDCEMNFLSILGNFFSKLSYFWWKVHFCYQTRSGSDHPAASSNNLKIYFLFYEIFQGALSSHQLRIGSHMWATFSSWSEIFGPSEIFFKKPGKNWHGLKKWSRVVRFLCPAARWTRADVYFPKHREFLQTFRQVWSYIDFPAARCERPEHFWSWDVFPVFFLYIIFVFF